MVMFLVLVSKYLQHGGGGGGGSPARVLPPELLLLVLFGLGDVAELAAFPLAPSALVIRAHRPLRVFVLTVDQASISMVTVQFLTPLTNQHFRHWTFQIHAHMIIASHFVHVFRYVCHVPDMLVAAILPVAHSCLEVRTDVQAARLGRVEHVGVAAVLPPAVPLLEVSAPLQLGRVVAVLAVGPEAVAALEVLHQGDTVQTIVFVLTVCPVQISNALISFIQCNWMPT